MSRKLDWLKNLGAHIYSSNLLTLQQIWRDEYPPEQANKHTLIQKVVFPVPLILRAISLSNLEVYFIRDGRQAYNFIDSYVLFWGIFLTILLLVASQIMGSVWLIIFIVIYRISDILSSNFCNLLIDSQKPDWSPASFRRSSLLILLNFYEIVIAYAILYRSVGNITNSQSEKLYTFISSFYFSLVTMTTLGYGDFIPKNDFSRFLVILEVFTGIFFLLIVIPSFISRLVTELGSIEECRKN